MTETTYGSLPGVEITVRGVAITGVIIGREQKLVVFGDGDTVNGTASENNALQVTSKREASDKFSADSELTSALDRAIQNGVSASDGFLYGVAVGKTQVSAELATDSSTLANAPIVEDTSEITFTDTSGDDLTVEFRYEDTLSTPSDGDTVFINPHTGDYEADSTADGSYEVDYAYYEWQDGLDSADGVLDEKETGIYVTVSDAESVASKLETKVDDLRDPSFKLVRGICGAQPNATADGTEERLDDGDAKINVDTYSDNIDNDSVFLITPAREESGGLGLLGAAGGLFSGNELDNPVYNDELFGVSPAQRFIKTERKTLRREHQVIAVESEGENRLSSNTSTSTETDWERDFHRRRIVDQVILLAKEVGDDIEGDLNDDDTRAAAQGEIAGTIEDLIADGILEANTSDSQNWFVDISEPSADETAIALGIKPQGVVKNVDITIDVEA